MEFPSNAAPASHANTGPARPAPVQIVVADLGKVGRYSVRLVQKNARDTRLILDVREYADGPNFQGWTRRGIRLTLDAEVPDLMRKIEKANTYRS